MCVYVCVVCVYVCVWVCGVCVCLCVCVYRVCAMCVYVYVCVCVVYQCQQLRTSHTLTEAAYWKCFKLCIPRRCTQILIRVFFCHNVIQIHAVRVNVVSFTPITKVRPSLRRFSLNSHIQQRCVEVCFAECPTERKITWEEFSIELHLWSYIMCGLTAAIFLKTEWVNNVLWTSGFKIIQIWRKRTKYGKIPFTALSIV